MLHRPLPLPFPLLALALLVACGGPPSPVAAAPEAAAEASVKPGINESFLADDMDPDEFVRRFEAESREIFVHRARIAALTGVRAGQAVADVGAGTGLFTFTFANVVGGEGKVYAVDIAAPFVERLRKLAADRGMPQVVPVQCGERDVKLPEASVDVVFVCDTYHHFEYPRSTLESIRRALRPGGELVVVDFIRIPGVSREWILDHVRAGQDQVEREIADAGFVKVRDEATPFLRENWMARYRRP